MKRPLGEMVETMVSIKIPNLDNATLDFKYEVREGAYFEDVERAIMSLILWNATIGTGEEAIGMANH